MLRFRKLQLKNWKNFASVDIELRDRMFLVGANATGKSNLLDAFRLLRDLASSGGGLAEAIRRREGVGTIRCLASPRDSDIEVGVDLRDGTDDAWTYELAFNQDHRGRPLVRAERVRWNDDVVLDRPDRDDRSDTARLTQTHLEQVTANLCFRHLAAFFSSIRYSHLVPQLVRAPNHSALTSDDPFRGNILGEAAQLNAKTRDARMRRIRDALAVAAPQLGELDPARDVRSLHHLSDGTLRLVGLLWATMDGEGPLLLEEPELSLHPEIVRLLPQMLARVQRRSGRQIFLSTHAPDLLRDSGIGLDETLLFVPKAAGTEVDPATSAREIRKLLDAGLSLAEVALPKTRPPDAGRLILFPEA